MEHDNANIYKIIVVYYAADVENKDRLSKVTGFNLEEAYFNCCFAIPDYMYDRCKGMHTVENRHYYPKSLIMQYAHIRLPYVVYRHNCYIK